MIYQYLDEQTIEVYFEDTGRFFRFYSSDVDPVQLMLSVLFRGIENPTLELISRSNEVTQNTNKQAA